MSKINIMYLFQVINGENAAIQSPKFSTMATRTRQEYLKDLANNYVSATTVDTGQKFCKELWYFFYWCYITYLRMLLAEYFM